MGTRRHFSREFKVEAVRMVTQGGHSLAEVARELGIRRGVLGRWRQQLERQGTGAFAGSGKMQPHDQEVRQLQRDLQRVTQERDILKKALAIFSERPR